MPKKIFKILEIIGILIIVLISFNLFPKLSTIFKTIYKVILPFLIGFSVAFILEPVVEFFKKHKIKRKLAIAIISFVLIGILFLVFRYLIPLVIKEVELLFKTLPGYIEELKETISKINNKLNGNYEINYGQMESFLIDKINTFLSNFGDGIQQKFSYFLQILITPILVIYFLLYYEKIESFVKEKASLDESGLVYEMLSKVKVVVRQYFKGVLIVMLILSLVATGCLWCVGLEFSLILGLIIGITDIIPYIGPYIGGGIVIIFTIVSNPTKTLIVLLIIVLLQLLESYLLVPKIQSKNLETNPIIVLLSVAVFGEILGIIGMIIAVPMVKILQLLVKFGITYKKYQKSR